MHTRATYYSITPNLTDNRKLHERHTRLSKNLRNEKIKHALDLVATVQVLDNCTMKRVKNIIQGMNNKEEKKFFQLVSEYFK
jgi:hypothetical protein